MAFNLKSDWANGDLYTAAAADAVAAAINTLVNGLKTATVATSENTTSTSYADLTTTTDQVTVTVGASGTVLLGIYGQGINSGAKYRIAASVDEPPYGQRDWDEKLVPETRYLQVEAEKGPRLRSLTSLRRRVFP